MTTVIKPIMVEEFLMEKLNLRGGLERMDERGWNKAKSLLKKVKVETIHMRVSRTHTVTGFSPRACKDLT
jgi:eukaryotic translation initiation factor 2C